MNAQLGRGQPPGSDGCPIRTMTSSPSFGRRKTAAGPSAPGASRSSSTRRIISSLRSRGRAREHSILISRGLRQPRRRWAWTTGKPGDGSGEFLNRLAASARTAHSRGSTGIFRSSMERPRAAPTLGVTGSRTKESISASTTLILRRSHHQKIVIIDDKLASRRPRLHQQALGYARAQGRGLARVFTEIPTPPSTT